MTVSTTSSSIVVACTGASQYSFPFIGVSSSYISVIYTTTTGAQTTLPNTAYTVSLNAPATGQIWGYGGTISPVTPANYASGTLTITRTLPLTQTAEISNQGNQYPIVTEQALDIQCMENQQTAARTGSWRATWATGIVYNFGDIVQDGINGANTNNWYVCVMANTSGTWSADLAAGDWILMLNLQSISNPGTVAAGGDLTGNYPNPTIAKIQGTVITGQTGTGNLVFGTSPTLVTPTLGAATGTSLTLSGLTASELVLTNGSKQLASGTALPNGTTATTQTALDNSAKVATTAYTDAAVAANPSLGVGQTWTDETSSRATSTNYTNTTGKPIYVSVYTNGGVSMGGGLLVGGVIVNQFYFNSVGGAPASSLQAIIPASAVYSVNCGFQKWFELR